MAHFQLICSRQQNLAWIIRFHRSYCNQSGQLIDRSFLTSQRYLNRQWATYQFCILSNRNCYNFNYANVCHLHLSITYWDKSKLEDSLKEKLKQKNSQVVNEPVGKESSSFKEGVSSTDQSNVNASQTVTKPSLWNRFVAEVKHYYHGFRLLGLDIRIASRTLWKIMRGKDLLRRERNQFRRAVADIFRLAPFSVFIIIPFAELALPIALKLFPSMLPSTFETKSTREIRLKKELKVKLEMAKFLQDTVEDIAVHTKQEKQSDSAHDFVEFFHKIRTSDVEPTNKDILKHAKLFQDELTLDNMTRPQLVALCRIIQVTAVGNNELLRFLIEMKLNQLHRDDELIMHEGVDSLTTQELMSACQARGMRALGVSRSRLKRQLSEWVDLHLNHDVPTSLLLLSRVLYLPETVPAEVRVKAAISTLPEKVAGEAEVRASELNLERVDNTTRYKAAKQLNAEIALEHAEAEEKKNLQGQQEEVKIKDVDLSSEVVEKSQKEKESIPEGPILSDSARVITLDEIDVIDEAISKLKVSDVADSEVEAAKSELNELREDVNEYKHDVQSLNTEIKYEKHDAELLDTTAGKLLQKRIDKMIGRMEIILSDLEVSDQFDGSEDKSMKEVAIHELVQTVQSLTQLPKDKLVHIFSSLDVDKDGHIDVKEASNIIKLLNKENVEVTPQQLNEIVKLLVSQLEVKETSEAKVDN